MREDEEKKKQQAEEDARKEEQQVGYASSLLQHISLCNNDLCSLLLHSNIPRPSFWTLVL